MKPKAALIILDGFGYREETHGNAIAKADMKFYQSLWKEYPHAILGASGLEVGLPAGQMGNSEVGHLNLGAGRVVYQTYAKIDQSIEKGSFFENPALLQACNHAARHEKTLHLMGLVSDGGVHSHVDHFLALAQLAKDRGVKSLFVHAFLDGRDVPPQSALEYLSYLEKGLKKIGLGKIATVMGRYYAMDRDNRWDRVQKAYEAMVCGLGEKAASAEQAVKASYQKGIHDEFVLPAVIHEAGTVKDGDGVIFVNFRPDRAREISKALAVKEFDGFVREKTLNLNFVCMAEYDQSFTFPVAFPPENMKNLLSEVLSQKGFSQLRLAETEKYAHVTFFFNGQIEKEFPLETRILIPSPQVATYDLKPEMSAPEVTEELLKQMDSEKFDVMIVNYANPDMVGHTGSMEATVKALQVLDACLEKVIRAFAAKNIPVIITADHGNADEMLDEQGGIMTAHSTRPVPLILVSQNKPALKPQGILADVAPTLLDLLGLEKPAEMTGESLILE